MADTGGVKQKEFWWSKFDWTVELQVADPCQRAALLADMFSDTADERDKYYDEILADIMSQRW